MTNSNTRAEVDKTYFTDLFNSIASAWNQGDREPYITKHVNCVYMVPNGETLSDPNSIRQFVEDFPEVSLQFEIVDAWGGGGRAGIHGKYNILNPDGSLMDKGKFIGAFEENPDEKWKMTHAIWNSDLPLPE
jgi:hypothetical protein